MDPTRKFPQLLAMSGGMTTPKLRRLKARRWKYPLSIERGYTSSIARYLDKVWKGYRDIAVGTMPRTDALEDLLDATSGPALGAIVSVAKNMSDFNRKELDAFKEIAIGSAFEESEPWLPGVIDRWSREQVSLITKASNDMRDAVARRVRDGIKKGLTTSDVTALVNLEMPGISHNRAKIIARDQCSKLNASLTEGRMQDAGLQTYIWDTAQDERVRGNPSGRYANALPSHFAMQGLVCRWDDPTVCRDKQGNWVPRPADAPLVHPGIAILCRCVALPNWEELEGVAGSDLPIQEVPEPSVQPAPEPQDSRQDFELLRDEKTFVAGMKGRYPGAKFTKATLSDVWDRVGRMDRDVQLAYDAVLTKWVASVSRVKRGSYSPGLHHIRTSASGDTFIHEAGHAIDNMLNATNRGNWRSFTRLDAFGGRNLGEIVKDELVTPILQAAEAQRPKVVLAALKNIPRSTLDAWREILSDQSRGQYYMIWDMARKAESVEVKRLVSHFQHLGFSQVQLKELVDGDVEKVADYITQELTKSGNARTRYFFNKQTQAYKELYDLAGTDDSHAVLDALGDMFEAATRVPDSFSQAGHGVRCWRDPENASVEAFAEILEMMGSSNPGAARILDRYLPQAKAFVLHIIKE